MRNLFKSVMIFMFVTLLQLSIYDTFLKPIITTWGASEKEVSMPMAGDDKALIITATRAILINAPKSEVWKWLVQLGADRGGFYSYSFIEEALGYETRHQDSIAPEFREIKVGDLVRGSIDEKRSITPYNFRVLYVEPEEAFVLDRWGTFFLEEINSQQTRLVIRSQDAASKSSWSRVLSYIEVPLHFIMERRMLMGIKAQAEILENIKISQVQDIFWLCGVVLSGFSICFLILVAGGVMQSVVAPSILSFLWMCSVFLAKPVPLYSIGTLLMTCVAILSAIISRKTSQSH